MTRTIGLFELTWHPQNLLNLARMADTEAADVVVFTDEATYDDWMRPENVDREAYEWRLRGEEESLAEYFDRVEVYCDDHVDFLMVVTPFGSGRITARFVDFDPDCVTACWLYNARACVESTRAAGSSRAPLAEATPMLRDALEAEDPDTAERTLKPYRYYMRPYILENYDAYLVEYPPIASFLDEAWEWNQDGNGDRDTPVYGELPPFLYEGDAEDDADVTDPGDASDRVEVTVSGRVVENVRDYDPVLDAFENLFETYGDDLGLSVLGRPVGGYGDRVMERCAELDAAGYPVTYYPDLEWIPTGEFERVLRRSDVLLNPIYLTEETTREPAPDERRSRTKGTGVLFDATKYAKPLVLPEGFTIAEMIEGATLTYGSPDELRETIARLVENPDELAERTRAARENARRYALDRQRERFHRIVEDVVTNARRDPHAAADGR